MTTPVMSSLCCSGCVVERGQDGAGRRCFAGLDLARVKNLSSLALLFPPVEDGER